MPNTSCQVPAATQTSGHTSRSGSMDTRRCVSGAAGVLLHTDENVRRLDHDAHALFH